MKLLVQRVSKASVYVNSDLINAIKQGLLVFVGYGQDDTEEKNVFLANKLLKLRIFDDVNGKMNHSVEDIKGEILLISQFTLYADLSRGRRPDFTKTACPEISEKLFDNFFSILVNSEVTLKKGIFGANMSVELTNKGPATFLLEK